jgi:hypothetical protein
MKHGAVAWSFGKTSKGFMKTGSNPGPGTYQNFGVDYYKSKAPHWKLGTADRSKSYKKNVPGPGNYNLSSSIGNSQKYTMRPKTGSEFDQKKEVPGPGNYNPVVSKKNDYAFSMRIRPQSASPQMNNPGPGTYSLRKNDSDFLKTHSAKFGTDGKCKDPTHTYIKNPGPGNYEFDREKINQTAPKFSFGKEERGNNNRPKTPGPGTYQPKAKMGNEGSKISMSFNRPLTGVKNENPGPGTYQMNLKDKNKAPEYKFGTNKRDNINRENLQKPGPGTYNPDNVGYTTRKAPQWKMGSEPRADMLTKSVILNPGAGTYEYKKTMGEAPKVNINIFILSLQKIFFNSKLKNISFQ